MTTPSVGMVCQTCSSKLVVHHLLATCFVPGMCVACDLISCHDTRCVTPLVEKRVRWWEAQQQEWLDRSSEEAEAVDEEEESRYETSLKANDDGMDEMIPEEEGWLYHEHVLSGSDDDGVEHERGQFRVCAQEIVCETWVKDGVCECV